MNETPCEREFPPQVRDLLWSRVSKRKNRHAAVTLAAWMYAQGLQWRTRKGFKLVRGSDKDARFGMKEREDLRAFGLTADKIRGAIKTLREVGWIVDRERSFYGVEKNFRGLMRRAPCRFAMHPEILSLMVKVKKTVNGAIRESLRACAALAAKLERSAAITHSPRENPSSSPPYRSFRTSALATGDLGGQASPKAPRDAQEPPGRSSPVPAEPDPRPERRPPETECDRRLEEILRRVEAGPPEPPKRAKPTPLPKDRGGSAFDRHLGAIMQGVLSHVVPPDPDPEAV